MFWLYLLLRPRYRHRTIRYVHVYWRHPRFHHALYWLSGLALIELALWVAVGEILGYWWLLWLAAKAVTAAVGRRRNVPAGWVSALGAMRPIWPAARA